MRSLEDVMKTIGTYNEWYCEETQNSQILQQNNLQYIQKTITNHLPLGVQSKFSVNGQKLKMCCICRCLSINLPKWDIYIMAIWRPKSGGEEHRLSHKKAASCSNTKALSHCFPLPHAVMAAL